MHLLRAVPDIHCQGSHRVLVLLLLGDVQQFAGITQGTAELVERLDDGLQAGTRLAQFTRLVRILPDFGVFQLLFYFVQLAAFAVEVKDTP